MNKNCLGFSLERLSCLPAPTSISKVVTIFLAVLLACLALPAVADAATAKLARKTAAKAPPASAVVKANGFSYAIEPEPSWVVAPQSAAAVPLPRAALHYDLLEEQVRVEAADASAYNHVVRVVDEAGGLGAASQAEFDFDPTFQTLAIHKLRLVRDGKTIDKLNKNAVKLLQRETALESRTYNGQVTASIVLDDVRIGDKIEYAYTIRGSNPVFGGKFVYQTTAGSWRGPVAQFQLRLLAPKDRKIQYRAEPEFEIRTALAGNERETIFRRIAVPQMQADVNAPGGYYIAQMIQLSEFGSWNEVAQWGANLFQQANLPSEAIRSQASLIRAKAAAPEAQLKHALDFVQNDIRYFGTQVGPYSYLPVAPDKVLSQRFGDCKGKVGLLIALLRELGIEAAPVMVSTFFRGDVAMLIPSGAVFDHMIAKALIGDQTYWLDGTRSHQTGQPRQRQSLGLGKGMVLRTAETALADLPGSEDEERIRVSDLIRIARFDQDPVLSSEITLYGELAEGVRSSLLSQPREQFEADIMSEYGRHYPDIRRNGPLQYEEVPDQNAITVRNEFTLTKYWNFDSQRRLAANIVNWNTFQALRVPNDVERSRPYRIKTPGIYRHTTTLAYPEEVAHGRDADKFDDTTPYFRIHAEHLIEPRQFRFDTELRITREQVAAADWRQYTDKVKALIPHIARTVYVSAIPLSQYDKLVSNLKELDGRMRSGDRRAKVATPVQRDSRLRNMVFTAQLESGRLSPRLRAEILRERGVTFDNFGQPEAAVEDFNEAIRLAPEDAKNYSAAAANAFQLGDDRRALELADRALALSSSDESARNVKNYLLYLGGNFRESKQNLLSLLKNSSEVEHGYSALKLYLATRRLGEDGAAAVRPYLPAGLSPRWPYPVLQLLIGSIDLKQALDAAEDSSRDPSKLCELYYYVGEKYLLDGDRRGAREYFLKSVETGVVEFNEYNLSKRRLKSLESELAR